LTVLFTEVLHPALALAMLFAALGALAYIFYLWSGYRFWLYGTFFLWPAAVLTFLISLAVTELVNPILTNAMIFFLAAGGLIYLLYYIRNRSDKVDGLIGEMQPSSQESNREQDDETIESIKIKEL
jgi:hypothetical protein